MFNFLLGLGHISGLSDIIPPEITSTTNYIAALHKRPKNKTMNLNI